MIPFTQRRMRVLQALEQANCHPCPGWHLGIYDGDTRILALAAAFYSSPDDRLNRAALFCRVPHYISMPTYVGRQVHFSLGSWKDAERFIPSHEPDDVELFVIRIEVAEWDAIFCIVCEDARFYRPQPPAFPVTTEDDHAV